MCILDYLGFPKKWLVTFFVLLAIIIFVPTVPDGRAATTIIYSNAGAATAWGAGIERSSAGVQLSSANRPAGENSSLVTTYVPGVSYWAYWRNTEFGSVINGPEEMPTADNQTIVVWWNGGGGPIEPTPDPWRYDQCLTNATLYVQFVTPVIGGSPGIGFTLAPGEFNCFSYVDDEKELIQFFISSFASNGDDLGQVVKTITTDDEHWYQAADYNPTNTQGAAFGIQLPRDLQSMTNNPIEFATPSEDLAREDTLKTGFGSVQGAVVSGIDLLNGQLRAQAAQLSAIDASIDGGFVTVNGNLVSVGSKIDSSNTKLDTLNTTVGAQTTSLGGKLDDIESGISLQTADIEEMRGHLHTLTNVQWSIRSQLVTNDNHFMTLFSVITNKMPAPNMTLATEQTSEDIEEQITLLRNDLNYDLENIGADVEASRGFLFDIRADQRSFTNQVGQFKLQLLATNSYLGDGIWSAVSNLNDVKLILAEEEELDPDLTNFLALIHGEAQQIRTNTNPLFEYNLKDDPAFTDQVGGQISGVFSNALASAMSDASNQVAASALFTNLAGAESTIQGLIGGSEYVGGPPVSDLWLVNIAGQEVNMNPLNIPIMVDMASYLRRLSAWISALIACYIISNQLTNTIFSLGQTPIGSSSLLHNIITWATAVWSLPFAVIAYGFAVYVLINAIGFAVPVVTTWLFAGAPWAMVQIFTGSGGDSGTGAGAFTATASNIILEGFKLANSFIAIDLIVIHWLWVIGFNFGVAKFYLTFYGTAKAVPK